MRFLCSSHAAAPAAVFNAWLFSFAIVRHDFIARQNDELTVKMGDSVRVLKMVSGLLGICLVTLRFRTVFLPLFSRLSTSGQHRLGIL